MSLLMVETLGTILTSINVQVHTASTEAGACGLWKWEIYRSMQCLYVEHVSNFNGNANIQHSPLQLCPRSSTIHLVESWCRAMRHITKKISCLPDGCHRKLAKWLGESYRVVLLPDFRTQGMIRHGQ